LYIGHSLMATILDVGQHDSQIDIKYAGHCCDSSVLNTLPLISHLAVASDGSNLMLIIVLSFKLASMWVLLMVYPA
jgi:hypothetical protein